MNTQNNFIRNQGRLLQKKCYKNGSEMLNNSYVNNITLFLRFQKLIAHQGILYTDWRKTLHTLLIKYYINCRDG